MLIRFTVENFLSFKDEVEFSMVAGKELAKAQRSYLCTSDQAK